MSIQMISSVFGLQVAQLTCASVYSTQYVTEMLETNFHVHCLCVDFCKAFDVVDHNIILSAKLA